MGFSLYPMHPILLVGRAGIALHNFPEGVAVFLASMKSQAVGLSLAVAIALHNVPEGVAVALPVYFATKSRWMGFKYAFLSGETPGLGLSAELSAGLRVGHQVPLYGLQICLPVGAGPRHPKH